MFDGYQEELSTKYGAHERRTGGRTGPTVDFTRDMVMKCKKEDLLSNNVKKQRFIRMLGQILEHVGCETRHSKGDADVMIVETTVKSEMSCETTLVVGDTDLCFVFMSRKILVKSSSNQRSGPEQRRVHDAGTSSMCKECWDVQFPTIILCCLLMPSSAVIQLLGYSAWEKDSL